MKIINAMFSKVNGGLEQVFLNYIPALKSQDNDVISVIHPKAEIRPYCPQENLRLIHNYNQHDLFALYRLRKLIKQEKPDCIITHSYRAAYLFKKTKTKIPKIAVCHVKSHYEFGGDAIIAITEHMRQNIIDSGKDPSTVFTVPNMIDIPPDLHFIEPVAPEVPVIGVCARFVDIKGVDVFIDALAELKRRNIRFRARIAGDGKEKERYIKQISQHGLQQYITLLGWVNDTESFYESIDIFCLPSREEAFGLVILESMKHSLPMVLTDLSGPREIVGDSNCAVLTPPENPIAMADALEQVIKEHELAKRIARNAFERVQFYSTERVGEILHEVIQKVI